MWGVILRYKVRESALDYLARRLEPRAFVAVDLTLQLRSYLLTWFRGTELKLLAVAVYMAFTTSIGGDEGIEQEDGYLARPAGNKLVLEFQKVE